MPWRRSCPSPLLKGKESVWAGERLGRRGCSCGRPSQFPGRSVAGAAPHCKPKVIYEFFGIAESTGQNKSKEIRQATRDGTDASRMDVA